MNPASKNDRQRMEHLFTTVIEAQYIFYEIRPDQDYTVLVKTPVEVKKIHVPRHLLGDAVLSESDRQYIRQQLTPLSLLDTVRMSNPDEINLPDYLRKSAKDSVWRRLLGWLD